MSGYSDLRDLGVQFGSFDGPEPHADGIRSPFDASWGSTIELLARELRHLDAKQIVIEIGGLGAGDLRNDGIPRANAKLGDAIRLSFSSRYGPLRYETGRFTKGWYGDALDGWQANLRAVALGLEALRKVDRYGITKRGEQYTGWKQLTSTTTPEDAIVTPTQARAVLIEAAGLVDPDRQGVALALDMIVTRAVKRSHPDVPGGSDDQFRKVQRAREILGV